MRASLRVVCACESCSGMGSRPAERLFNVNASESPTKLLLSSLTEAKYDVGLTGNTTVQPALKKETADEEITEYAATAMSELLGWYGYEKVDSGYIKGLNLDHFAPTIAVQHHLPQMDGAFLFKGVSSKPSPFSVSSNRPKSLTPSLTYTPRDLENISRPSNTSPLSLKMMPASSRLPDNINSPSSSPDGLRNCSWCGRVGNVWEAGRSNGVSYNVNALGEFCSEACFVADRKAAFTRAKTCDWCQHVRNSVSHADFQDEKSQLQFCSDKCLNQYKMNIFCRETQTHLALHGLSSIPSSDIGSGGLITPELWLRNCHSPSHSPSDDLLVMNDKDSNVDEVCYDEGASTNRLLSMSLEDREQQKRQDTEMSEGLNFEVRRMRNRFRLRNRLKDFDTSEKSPAPNPSSNNLAIQDAQKYHLFEKQQMSQSRSKSPLNHNLSTSLGTSENPTVRENAIHIRNIKELRERKDPQNISTRNTSNVWKTIPTTISSGISCTKRPFHNGSASPNFPSGNESTEPTASPPHTNRPHGSLLPPVTILVPYPIPIPIPIPIPMPASLLDKFQAEKKEPSSKESETADENPSAVRHSVASTTSRSQTFDSFTPVNTTNDKTPVHSIRQEPVDLQNLSRPLRKRKRVTESSEDADLTLKRRSKFLAV